MRRRRFDEPLDVGLARHVGGEGRISAPVSVAIAGRGVERRPISSTDRDATAVASEGRSGCAPDAAAPGCDEREPIAAHLRWK